jgi:hypothetical protein
MQAADTARAKGAAIGVVTVLPQLAMAAVDAARILRGQDLEASVHMPIGDPATEIARVAHDHAYDSIYVGRREAGSGGHARPENQGEGGGPTAARTTVIAR